MTAPWKRPVCWRRGHHFDTEQYVEALPLPFLVCGRCGKHAPDELQMAHYRRLLRESA